MELRIVSRVVKRPNYNISDVVYVVQQEMWDAEGFRQWIDVVEFCSLNAAKLHKEMMYKHHDMVVG